MFSCEQQRRRLGWTRSWVPPRRQKRGPFICQPGTSKCADPNLVTVALAAERQQMSGWSCSSSPPTRAVIRKQHPQEGETHTVPTNEPLCQNLTAALLQVEDAFTPSHLCFHRNSYQFRFCFQSFYYRN